jgi:very-short-patch-repair endonuclease
MSRMQARDDPSIEKIQASRNREEWMTGTARELRQRATPSEAAWWERHRGRRLGGFRFRRQQPIGPYVVDSFCSTARLIVEVDGPIHVEQEEHDNERQAQLEGAGYRVLRITAHRMLHDLPDVLREIEDAITPESHPLSRAQGEGAGG